MLKFGNQNDTPCDHFASFPRAHKTDVRQRLRFRNTSYDATEIEVRQYTVTKSPETRLINIKAN